MKYGRNKILMRTGIAIFFAFLAVISAIVLIYIKEPQISETPYSQEKTQRKIFTLAEVSQHNSSQDCWMAINGKVYNLTEYIKSGEHPTPHFVLIKHCGTDATEAFNTKGGMGEPHSPYAHKLLEKYYIGDLAQ